jgi:hypothetical protein
MKFYLKPDEYHDSIFHIDLDSLKSKNIKGLLVDLDNTLMPWNELAYTNELINWLNSLKTQNFKVCIVSNNGHDRGRPIALELDLPLVAFARKPSKSAFKKALDILKTDVDRTAVIGDQLFTDVLGGKRVGLYTILVKPISKNEFWGTKMVRFVERIFLKMLGLG